MPYCFGTFKSNYKGSGDNGQMLLQAMAQLIGVEVARYDIKASVIKFELEDERVECIAFNNNK